MRGRAPASDSVAARTAAAQSLPPEVPEGMEPLTEAEKTAFDHYGAFRIGWTVAELRGLHRLVRLESKIAALEKVAESSEQFIPKHDGTLTVHPVHKEIRDESKVMQTQLRLLGLNITPEGRRKIANSHAAGNPKVVGTAVASLVRK